MTNIKPIEYFFLIVLWPFCVFIAGFYIGRQNGYEDFHNGKVVCVTALGETVCKPKVET